MSNLSRKVSIVTGATRGIGKGIALQLAGKDSKVYITGCTKDSFNDESKEGSLRDTVEEAKAR